MPSKGGVTTSGYALLATPTPPPAGRLRFQVGLWVSGLLCWQSLGRVLHTGMLHLDSTEFPVATVRLVDAADEQNLLLRLKYNQVHPEEASQKALRGFRLVTRVDDMAMACELAATAGFVRETFEDSHDGAAGRFHPSVLRATDDFCRVRAYKHEGLEQATRTTIPHTSNRNKGWSSEASSGYVRAARRQAVLHGDGCDHGQFQYVAPVVAVASARCVGRCGRDKNE